MNGLTGWVFTARKHVKSCRSCLSSYVLLALAFVGANAAQADAKLVNFDSRFRVPGEYEIIFKRPSELRSLPGRYADPASSVKRPSVLADTLPLTREALNSLAEALTKSINGKFGTMMEGVSADDLPALFIVTGVSGETIKSLAKDPRIAIIAASLYSVPDSSQATLRDPLGQDSPDYLWNLDRIDQVRGPPNGAYVYFATAFNVNAWVLDTGIFSENLDFVNNRVKLQVDCSSGTCSAGIPSCGFNPTQENEDPYGHGTEVAGVIGGSIHGVAKQINLISVMTNQVDCSTTNGYGSPNALMAAINYVVANKNLLGNSDIINISSHSSGLDPVWDSAVKYAISHGITVVVSAGNEGGDACNYSPADLNSQAGGYPGLIIVGSSTRNDQMDPSFNYGKCLSIFAPGRSILTAAAPWGAACGGCTRNVNAPYDTTSETWAEGTSFAAPIVTGIGALYLQTHPNATPAQVKTAIVNAGSVLVLANNLNNSPNLLANSCVPGNNSTLDPNAGCGGGSGGTGGGSGGSGGNTAAVRTVVNLLLLGT